MLWTILKTAGLILSFAGWMRLLAKLLRVDFCFIPAAVLSTAALAVYFGGIFGLLYPAALAVYAGGIVLFCVGCICQYCKKKAFHWNLRLHLREICLGAGTLCFLSLLPNAHFQHYDNFSHWGIVVKLMLSTDAFPTADTGMIDFLNYPLGTSSVLYYVCRFSSRSEGSMLLAQGVLIFAFFYAIFGMIRHPKCFLLSALLGAGLSMLSFFNITIRINNLVDFLLPVVTLACWAVILRYSTQLEKMLPLLMLYQSFLLIIKNTGAIYLAFTCCVFLLRVPRAFRRLPVSRHGKKLRGWEIFLPTMCTLLLSGLSWAAWQYHCKTAFPDVVNKFDTDLVEIGAAGTGKSPEELRTILTVFVQTVLDITTRPTLGFVLLNLFGVACAAGIWVRWHKPVRTMLVSQLLLNGMVIVYYLGILGLYLYSMPSDEAVVLAGFDRYACSIIVLFAGGLVLRIEERIEDLLEYHPDGMVWYQNPAEKRLYQKWVLFSLTFLFLVLTSEYNGTRYTAQETDYSLPEVIQSVTGDRWPEGGKEDETRYLLYGSDRDGQMTSYYFQYVARYYLYAPHVDAVCVFYEPNLENLLSGYDCLVIVEPDIGEQRMLKRNFGIDGTAGFYRIDRTAEGLVLTAVSDSNA